MRKALTIVLLAALALPRVLVSQDTDPAVSTSGGPPSRSWTARYKYTQIGGADYVEYICMARTTQNATSNNVTQVQDSANTAAVTTASPHGLAVNNRVTLAGISGAAGLNGTFIVLTVPSPTIFTVATSGVADAVYNNAGITLSSTAPRTTDPIWAIKKYLYGGTGGTQVVAIQWAIKPGNQNSGTGNDSVCDNTATLAFQ